MRPGPSAEVVDMFRSGMLNPDSPAEIWTRLLFLPEGEVAIPPHRRRMRSDHS